MQNLDVVKQEQQAVVTALYQAMAGEDNEALGTAMNNFSDYIKTQVLAEAKNSNAGMVDRSVLSSRGVHVLTSEENEYYNSVIGAIKNGWNSSPKMALTDVDKVLPKTVIEMVFEDIKSNYPLLDMIDFQNTEALIDIVMSAHSGSAVWGELCSTITAELAANFTIIPLGQKKLSAFIPVCKAMLDLGPAWLDRYVRAILTEAIAAGLELAVVDGDGDGKPLGMSRALTGATDSVYPRKTAVAVTTFDPDGMSTILQTLATGVNGENRAISEVVLVVNPADYFSKVFPATTVKNANGEYNTNVFPFPTKVVQSAAVLADHAVIGLPKRYFLGLGTGKAGKLEYSDEYKFLEDVRTYLIKLYGNGRPKDANAFVYLDISALGARTPDAALKSLTVGDKVLTPLFNKGSYTYAAATTDATNKITVVPAEAYATVAIKNGATTVANGSSATWEAGENTVTITVTFGGQTKTYTVVVTKS